MTPPAHHDLLHLLQWDARLLDWVDGMFGSAHSAAIERHVRQCGCCRQRVAELRELDRRLSQAAPRLALDSTFDLKLLAQLTPIHAVQRAAARRGIAEETNPDQAGTMAD